jgi:hypothetical protein
MTSTARTYPVQDKNRAAAIADNGVEGQKSSIDIDKKKVITHILVVGKEDYA